MVKLLAIDMDGTCLDHKHRISDENMEALRQAAEAGILVVPTTGRTTTCIPRQLMEEHFYQYIISSNGADVADLRTQTSLYRSQIPCRRAVKLLQQCEKAGLGLSVHAGHQFLIQGRGLYTLGRVCYGEDAKHSRYEKNIARYLEQNHMDVEEIQLFFFNGKKRKLAREILEQQKDLTAAYDQFYAEVYTGNASKGNALAALAEHLQIPKEQVACIGDGENDLSMFAASGVKFAMGNGIEELRQRADVVLPDNNSSGVAAAIREHLLK